MSRKVLIVDDEPDIIELVTYNFAREGFAVKGFKSAAQALESMRRDVPDLLILDIMMPGESGMDFCRRIRGHERFKSIPVIFLTARGEEIDRILGLEIGADDYVTKPFSPRELLARAKAVLRRQTRDETPNARLVEGSLIIDSSTQEVFVAGRPALLSALEFKLLHFLASKPRHVFSREQLLDRIWGLDCNVTARTVDVHIRRLREKIEAHPEEPELIQTVRGFGYRFCSSAE